MLGFDPERYEEVRRRIGGLEKDRRLRLYEASVRRRIGGLEMSANHCSLSCIVRRRIGGLE